MLFRSMRNLHLTNNFLAYILPAIVQPFNIILVKTYMESISPALQEAAEIDGASVMKVFMKIMLPLAKPIMATIAIFAAVGQWNSFQAVSYTHLDVYKRQMLSWTACL